MIKKTSTGKKRNAPVDDEFIEVGHYPNSGFMLDLVETNQAGEIHTNESQCTGGLGTCSPPAT